MLGIIVSLVFCLLWVYSCDWFCCVFQVLSSVFYVCIVWIVAGWLWILGVGLILGGRDFRVLLLWWCGG